MNRIRPNLLSDTRDGDCETLNLPNIEWAGRKLGGDEARYEFIGRESAPLSRTISPWAKLHYHFLFSRLSESGYSLGTKESLARTLKARRSDSGQRR